MKIRTTWRRTAAVLVAGAFVLTACSSDGDTTDDDTTDEETDDSTDEEPDDEETGDDDMGDMEVATDFGVTEEPCPADDPETVNADNGCIYLGIISDLTAGPFSAAGPAIVDAQRAFWRRVNEDGGIGGAYDVNVSTYVRDNLYVPETHNAVYQEIKPNILGLAQTLGSPTTAAIVDDLISSNVVSAPASWTSALEFTDVILESGASYCVEASNALDYFASTVDAVGSVMAVHLPGDYGWDGAAGAKKWAEANGATFTNQQVTDSTDAAINAIVNENPDVVVLTLGPTDTATVVGTAAGRGYQGRFIGNSPTWNPALLATPAAPALQALYWQAGPVGPYSTDTPGHQAMRDQLEAMADSLETYDPAAAARSDFYTSGWFWSYPLKAVLDAAYEAGDMTRAGVAAQIATVSVDYEGMLPDNGGVFTGTPAEQAFRQSVVSAPDAEAVSGVSVLEDFFVGDTAAAFPFEQPCFVEEGFA